MKRIVALCILISPGFAAGAMNSDERAYVQHDPAVSSGLFQWNLEPFTELGREAPAGSR